jgi:hypothetical protein
MNDDFLSCFYHETRILRELEHPNILPIYDSGYSHNYLYRVVELCNARNLAEQLGQGLLRRAEEGGPQNSAPGTAVSDLSHAAGETR